MTEAMIVEAVRAAGAGGPVVDPITTGATLSAPDPAAVERFQAAMGASGPSAVGGPSAVSAAAEDPPADPIPFASEASAVWRSAQANNQTILHRIRALSQLEGMHGPSSAEMIELQYEVANLAFQQEVVTKVADKSSNAIQTLIKNQ